MSKRKKEKKSFLFFVGGEWRQQFVVTEVFKQIVLKICNKVLYFRK